MNHSYIIIDDSAESVLKTLSVTAKFQNLQFLASANSYEEGLDLILEHSPTFVFLEISPEAKDSNLSLSLINELHRFMTVLPKIVITSNNVELALQAIRYGAFDYLPKPINGNDLRKTILKFEKSSLHLSGAPLSSVEPPLNFSNLNNSANQTLPTDSTIGITGSTEHATAEISHQQEGFSTEIPTFEEEPQIKTEIKESTPDKPLIICVKSYGDYRFIEAKDICYLQADNNSTDIHLFNGEMITAFKTLKHFENVLSSPFVRIHNSYIVNIDYVSRIHTGNSVCYIKNTTTKLPFSKSYKENVDAIINSITKGNYLEI